MTDSSDEVTNDPRTRRHARNFLVAAVAVVLAFLIGFGWQYLRARQSDQRAAYAERALEGARLEALLGGAVIDAQAGKFELSRQRASAFFSRLQDRLAPGLDSAVAPSARQIISQRDGIITALARSDPAAESVLARLLNQYRGLIAQTGLDSVRPVPRPGP
jgi:hypothetical protein